MQWGVLLLHWTRLGRDSPQGGGLEQVAVLLSKTALAVLHTACKLYRPFLYYFLFCFDIENCVLILLNTALILSAFNSTTGFKSCGLPVLYVLSTCKPSLHMQMILHIFSFFKIIKS